MSISLPQKIEKFLPAVVKSSRNYGAYIEFYVLDKESGSMVRQRIRCQKIVKRYRTKREQQMAVQAIADNINNKLAHGWSPLHESEDARLYTPMPLLRERFLAYKKAEGIRDSTMQSYTCITGLFVSWVEESARTGIYSGTFLRQDAVSYMDSLKDDGSSNRNYNNHLKVLRSMMNWAVEHCYAKECAFQTVKALKNEKKKRILIDAASRRLIAGWCKRNSPQFGIVCRLVYSAAMRPKEIANIQLKHVDLERHCVVVPEENAKNGKQRCATLSPELVELMRVATMGLDDGELFLFSQQPSMVPGRERVSLARFRKKWDALREDLALPKEMQLYSLRDTGITDMLHAGIDQLTVQHHVDHSSLAVQAIYTDHFDVSLNDTIYNKGPRF